MRHEPMKNCKHCGGTGVRISKPGFPCICTYVDHDLVELAWETLSATIKKFKNDMGGGAMFLLLRKRNPENNYTDEIVIRIGDISTMESVDGSSLITLNSGREICTIESLDEIRLQLFGDDDEDDEDDDEDDA